MENQPSNCQIVKLSNKYSSLSLANSVENTYLCKRMTMLSVNINKVATLRNARGGNLPDVIKFALDCEQLGAQGITVHPRPDERHIRRSDVLELKQVLTTEFNIEGNPAPAFVDLVCAVCPNQVTLVPDAVNQITSNHGWDTVKYEAELRAIINVFHQKNIRVSVFVDPDPEMVVHAKKAGADRVELYTGPYAGHFLVNPEEAVAQYRPAAEKAKEIGIGLNAGHDLNLQNLPLLLQAFPWIDEVSIGHALISDALYLGIKETIRQYRQIVDK